ncbi:MAG: 16S rRNA (cytosine(1402)-N(4))-methyltransferase RsmH [Leptospiraceae bacterium]|nr:16S rRNA (cytosine(1402)-N(4))-methyltransferase RsmH [Leptospiraceae bacterium]MCZ8345355.1 16S rRNA (cytosine(1402)-N(4))-methyltransferase RsmH [Leptospiraceae bacterium]
MYEEEFQAVHFPVMWQDVLRTVQENIPKSKGLRFLDGTGGEAGHVLKLAEAYPDSEILFLDRDPTMIQRAWSRLGDRKNIKSINCNYSELAQSDLEDLGWRDGFDGILLDLGISTYHILESGRGFSFKGTENFDMRLDTNLNTKQVTAAEIVNTYPSKELERIFYEYGEERWTKKIVERLLERRRTNPIESNNDFSKLVESTIPRKFWPPKTHPATRVYQAIRIEVNQEFQHLKKALVELPKFLKPDGIFQIISFHSLEDRIVKHSLRELVMSNKEFSFIYKKPLLPSEEEMKLNPASRSAKLRAIQRSTDTRNKRY